MLRSTVADQRVKIELVYGFDPLPVSSTDEKSFGFQIIKKTILDLFPSVAVAPGIKAWNCKIIHLQKMCCHKNTICVCGGVCLVTLLTRHVMFACAGVCVGNTDSRHFRDLTSNIYRFAPLWFKPGDAQR